MYVYGNEGLWHGHGPLSLHHGCALFKPQCYHPEGLDVSAGAWKTRGENGRHVGRFSFGEGWKGVVHRLLKHNNDNKRE